MNGIIGTIMKIQLIIALLIVKHGCEAQTECSKNCSTPVRLIPPKPLDLQLNITSIPAIVLSSPQVLTGLVYKVTRYFQLCPWKFSRKDNSHCTFRTEVVDPPIQRINEILKHTDCLVGSECSPDSNECDAGGVEHCSDIPVLDRWQNKPTFTFLGAIRMNSFSSTCVQEWVCLRKQIDFPIHIYHTPEKGMVLYTYSTDNKFLELSETTQTFHRNSDGSTTMIPQVPITRDKGTKVQCILRPPKTMCIVQESRSVEKGRVFPIGPDCYGAMQNHLIKIDCLTSTNIDEIISKGGGTASIEQVALAVNMIFYEQLQSHYNSLTLAAALIETQSLMESIVTSLSKTNPQLLGDLMKRSSRTQWINSGSFVQCPCREVITQKGLCSGNFILEGGIPRRRVEDSECFPNVSYSHEAPTTNITMFRQLDMSFEEMSGFDFNERPQDDWVDEKERASGEGAIYDGSKESEIMNLLNRILTVSHAIFVNVGCFCGIVSFLSFFCACFRKPV